MASPPAQCQHGHGGIVVVQHFALRRVANQLCHRRLDRSRCFRYDLALRRGRQRNTQTLLQACQPIPTPPDSRLHPVALLESDEAIQASIMEVVNALARNTIDLRRADLILKALWIAVKNSRRARFDIWANRMVTEIPNYPATPAHPRTQVEATASAVEIESVPTPQIEADGSAQTAPKRARAAKVGKG